MSWSTYAGRQAKGLWVSYLQAWQYALTGERNPSGDYWALLARVGGSLGDGDRGAWIEAARGCHSLDSIQNETSPTAAERNHRAIVAAMRSLVRCSESIATSGKRPKSTTRRTNQLLVEATAADDQHLDDRAALAAG